MQGLGIDHSDPLLGGLVQLHQQLNPEIAIPRKVLQKKVIYLGDLHLNRSCQMNAGLLAQLLSDLSKEKSRLSGSKAELEQVVPKTPAEVEAMRFALGFNEVMGQIGTATGVGVSTVSTLAGKHLQSDILEFNRWARERAQQIVAYKGKTVLDGYDARLDEIVKRIKSRVGLAERFLFTSNGVKGALFHGVPKGLDPKAISISAAEHVKQVASKAKVAGVALTVVDAALICHKLSNTEEDKKVATAYEEVGGFAGQILSGLLVGVAVSSMATPWVGWGPSC